MTTTVNPPHPHAEALRRHYHLRAVTAPKDIPPAHVRAHVMQAIQNAKDAGFHLFAEDLANLFRKRFAGRVDEGGNKSP